MRNLQRIASIIVLPFFISLLFGQTNITFSQGSTTANLIIEGMVSNPLSLTYGEMQGFLTVWENASLQCVYAPAGQTYNWSGVPLFYLLSLAGVQPGARKVVFRASDGFSSSLTLDKAMHPTTILALTVDNVTLPAVQEAGGLPAGYPYKVVAPCKFGYKWVGWVNEIEVVNYDYLGTYESSGFSDEADIPNCTALPETKPAYLTLNVPWEETLNVTVFANSTITDASLNQTTKRIQFTLSSDNTSESLAHLALPKKLLAPDFTVYSDGAQLQKTVIQSQANSFISFSVSGGEHNIEVKGRLPADITGPDGSPDGKVDLRDVAYVARRFMTTPTNPIWDPNADLNSDGKIDMQDIGMAARHFGETSA